jgi:hypothetical protein
MSFPKGLIEDNLIIEDWAGSTYGVYIADEAAASGGLDDANTAITVRNNTIWLGPQSNGEMNGIRLGTDEGTGYVFANNTINYTASSSNGRAVNCFEIGRGYSNVAFMNNNHCNVTPYVSYTWEKTQGSTLAEWKKNSGFDSASILTPPNFKNATSSSKNATSSSGYDFTPARDQSPLIGTGDASHGAGIDLTNTQRPPTSIGAFEPSPL